MLSLNVLSYPSVIAGIDFNRVCFELEATLRRHGARTQAAPLDVVWHSSASGRAAIASFVLESERIERAVVTHVRVAPFFAGVALAVHPRADLDAPMLVADLMVPPPGVTRAYVDACGPAIAAPSFSRRFREPLADVVDGAGLGQRRPVPAWMAPLSGGCGARLRARPGGGDAVARVLVSYVSRYLRGLEEAEPAADPRANAAAARIARDVIRSRGTAGKRLARSFGTRFAGRYLDLLWEAKV